MPLLVKTVVMVYDIVTPLDTTALTLRCANCTLGEYTPLPGTSALYS